MAGGINYTHIWLQEIIYGSWSRFKCCHWIWKGFFMFRESSIFLRASKALKTRMIWRRVSLGYLREKPNPRQPIKTVFRLSFFITLIGTISTALLVRLCHSQAKRNEKNCLSHLSFSPRFTMRVSRKRVCSWRRRVVKIVDFERRRREAQK